MADLESEIKDLKEKNTELVQKVQYWKMTAAQRENEKLDLMKEINDLRLKLSRIRSGGAAHARKLDAALQSASEEALSALVQASGAVARTLELAKTYMQDQQELETAIPRWSTLSSTPSSEKINKVPPMLIGGRLIQPVVSLSRTLQSNYSGSVRRRPNETNQSVSERVPLPLHMLQDVYIPLTRIDAGEIPVNNVENHIETNEADDSTEDLALDDSTERLTEEPQNVTESEDLEESRRLDPVSEDIEPEDNLTPERSITENPLEGPSWLLDRPRSKRKVKSSTNFEPDSTTEFEDSRIKDEPGSSTSNQTEYNAPPSLNAGMDVSRREFTPTVRRRARASPPASPPRHSNNGRILKVLVAKMRLDDDLNDVSPPKRSKDETPQSPKSNPQLSEARRQSAEGSPKFQIREVSPSKILMRFDAPSPNGSTDSRVIVLESKHNQPEPGCSGISKSRTLKRVNSNDSRNGRNNSHQGDSQNKHQSDSQNKHQSDSQNRYHNDSQNTHENDSQNCHLNDSQNGRQNVIENRQLSESQCDSETRHQSDNNMSNNHIRHRSVSQNRRQRGSRTRYHSDNDNPSRDSHNNINISEHNSHDSDSSGSELVSESRTRRPRKAIVYKEKPLNRKLRR